MRPPFRFQFAGCVRTTERGHAHSLFDGEGFLEVESLELVLAQLESARRTRLASKKVSKTESVQSQLDQRLADENIHIGPSDYVPWQNDNKICFLRMEWRGFGDVPMNLEARLSVEDSPNSAGVVIDAVRCAKLALDRKIGGPLDAASACMMKHPRKQMRDSEAFVALEQFIQGQDGMTRAPLRRISADSQEELASQRQLHVDSLKDLDQVRPGLAQREAVGVKRPEAL